MIEHIDIINSLHTQISALLDLMECANSEYADVNSMMVASGMCQTMLDELMIEIGKIEELKK